MAKSAYLGGDRQKPEQIGPVNEAADDIVTFTPDPGGGDFFDENIPVALAKWRYGWDTVADQIYRVNLQDNNLGDGEDFGDDQSIFYSEIDYLPSDVINLGKGRKDWRMITCEDRDLIAVYTPAGKSYINNHTNFDYVGGATFCGNYLLRDTGSISLSLAYGQRLVSQIFPSTMYFYFRDHEESVAIPCTYDIIPDPNGSTFNNLAVNWMRGSQPFKYTSEPFNLEYNYFLDEDQSPTYQSWVYRYLYSYPILFADKCCLYANINCPGFEAQISDAASGSGLMEFAYPDQPTVKHYLAANNLKIEVGSGLPMCKIEIASGIPADAQYRGSLTVSCAPNEYFYNAFYTYGRRDNSIDEEARFELNTFFRTLEGRPCAVCRYVPELKRYIRLIGTITSYSHIYVDSIGDLTLANGPYHYEDIRVFTAPGANSTFFSNATPVGVKNGAYLITSVTLNVTDGELTPMDAHRIPNSGVLYTTDSVYDLPFASHKSMHLVEGGANFYAMLESYELKENSIAAPRQNALTTAYVETWELREGSLRRQKGVKSVRLYPRPAAGRSIDRRLVEMSYFP